MKKFVIGAGVVVIIAVFIFLMNRPVQTSDDNLVSSTPATNNNQLGTNPPTSAGNTNYKDGTYTGKVSSASVYGDIQVSATIRGGKIVDIAFLQFPTGGGHTSEVTAFAEPALKQEAILTQSANVDIVSGATQDTQAFIESLQSALDQAKM